MTQGSSIFASTELYQLNLTMFSIRPLIFLLAVRSASAFPTQQNPHTFLQQGGNEWKSAVPGDSRSPCPALNTLANHGYLPRNGKAISADMLSKSIQTIYNVDPTLAFTLSHAAFPLTSNTSAVAGLLSSLTSTINLDTLNMHDAIEHDASLTRNDFAQGDNHSLQPKLLEALLADASGDFLTVESLAKSRVRRESESQTAGSKTPLTKKTLSLAYGEAALLLQALGTSPSGSATGADLKAPKSAVQTWFGEEKLPAGYVKPAKPITATSTQTLAAVIQAAATKLKGGAAGAAAKPFGSAARFFEWLMGSSK